MASAQHNITKIKLTDFGTPPDIIKLYTHTGIVYQCYGFEYQILAMIRSIVRIHFQHGLRQNLKHQYLNIMNIQQSDVKILNMVGQSRKFEDEVHQAVMKKNDTEL